MRKSPVSVKLLVFILLITIVFFFIGCVNPDDTETQDIIKIGDPDGDWGFPSPYGMYSRGPGYIRMSMLFDTLVWKDRDGNIIPMLASSWQYDEDSNVFTFNLREDVRFHDGEKFNASDVVFTFDYIKMNPWPWVDSSFIDSVRVVDDYTVEIHLAKEYAPFLNNIAGTMPILPRHIWQDIDDPLNYKKENGLIGTGPFIFKDYNTAEGSYLYEANEDYYLGGVNIKNIAFIKVAQESASAMLERGDIDAAPIPPDLTEKLDNDLIIEKEPPIWAAKLIINHNSNEILKNKKFRQALAHAIDKQQIVEISRRGFAVEGSAGLMPPANSYWYNEDTPQYYFDNSKARGIIESLGWVTGDDGYYYKDGSILRLELAVSGPDFERDAQVIKENLEDAGIKVDISSYESKTLDDMIENWQFDIAVSGHGGLGGDPESLNRVIIGQGFNSVRYFENEKLIELLKSQVNEMDKDVRQEMVYEIQKIYAEELPSITLYYPRWYWAHNERANIFYTEGGIAIGIPIPVNKIAFIDT